MDGTSGPQEVGTSEGTSVQLLWSRSTSFKSLMTQLSFSLFIPSVSVRHFRLRFFKRWEEKVDWRILKLVKSDDREGKWGTVLFTWRQISQSELCFHFSKHHHQEAEEKVRRSRAFLLLFSDERKISEREKDFVSRHIVCDLLHVKLHLWLFPVSINDSDCGASVSFVH